MKMENNTITKPSKSFEEYAYAQDGIENSDKSWY